jgi:hypothetical protein
MNQPEIVPSLVDTIKDVHVETLFATETLLGEVIVLCGDQYRPKY